MCAQHSCCPTKSKHFFLHAQIDKFFCEGFPSHQRQGVGTALLREVLNRFSQVRQIQLATDNTPKTLAFYKSLGFWEMSELGCRGFMRG